MRSVAWTRAMRRTDPARGAVGGWIDAAAGELDAAGVASPLHDARRLAARALGVEWSDLWSLRSQPPSEAALRTMHEMLQRRLGGEPLAYIEGTCGFYGLELRCGPGVLVPRPETETLVDVALELIDGVASPVVVDIGTGTGAVALAIASRRDDAEIVATDISEEALRYARANAAELGARITLELGDLFDAVPRGLRGRVDLVVSNPPYVADGAELPPDVRAEPASSLFAGPRGTDVLARIVAAAPSWLAPGGAVALEICGAEQADVLPGSAVRRDLTGAPRVVWARP